MDLRTIGGSGLRTPRLVLGGNVFGWTATGAEAFAILDRFAEAGGVMIDTADVYSAWVPGHKGGESESLIGEWLKRRGRRDDVLIATKTGMMPWDGKGTGFLDPDKILASCDASLARLGIETIDLYYAHQDDKETPLADQLGAFDTLVKAGKVRTIAASNYSAERLTEALDISARDGLARYEALQNEYNLMTRDKFEGALQQLCLDRNIGSLPFYGLASGFLTGKYRSEADKGKSVRGGRMDAYMNARGFCVLDALEEVAGETGATKAQVALAWVAAQPGITAPIASATSRKQLDELLSVLTLELTGEQVERLTAAGA
jgi:aryl-alcohol dehydrogenase-like predicted oxidoreductase